jgi:CubicO group peptidase (beta-lactamase class C family)
MSSTNVLAALAAGLSLILPQTELDTRIDAAARAVGRDVPGLAVAVGQGDSLTFAKGFGSTSPAAAEKITPNTQFRIASVSKPMTAAAIFKLLEQGRLDLDRPARDYCAPLAALNGAPTVRQFLLHQSGMRHTSDQEDETITGAPASFAESLARIVREPLTFPPGRGTLYTSWGYTALGCVIESVSGRPYQEFVSEAILRPAGMTGTTFDEPRYAAPQFSPGYRRQGARFVPSVVVDTRFKTPASGLISTATDLVRFGLALVNHRLLTEPVFRQMLASTETADGRATTFTAGWIAGPANLGVPAFNSNGSMEGTTAFLAIVPDRKVVVSVLANRERFVPGIVPVAGEALRAALALPPRP